MNNNFRSMKKILVLIFCLIIFYSTDYAYSVERAVYNNKNVHPFYKSPNRDHSQYTSGGSTIISFDSQTNYVVYRYIDTDEWSVKDSVYSRLVFVFNGVKTTEFINDEAWVNYTILEPFCSYDFCRTFSVSEDYKVLLFSGFQDCGSSPNFTIFLLDRFGNVTPILHQQFFIKSDNVNVSKEILKLQSNLVEYVDDEKGSLVPCSEPDTCTMVIDYNGIKIVDRPNGEETIVLKFEPITRSIKSVGDIIFNGLQSRERINNNKYFTDLPWTGGNKEVTITFKNLVIESDKGDSYTFPELSLEMFRKYFPEIKIDISLNPSINDAFEVADYKAENWDCYLRPWEDFRVRIYRHTAGGIFVAACDISEIFGGDHPTSDVVHTLGFKITATSKSGTTILLDQNTSSKCIPLVQMAP